jgi:hypothetical protein
METNCNVVTGTGEEDEYDLEDGEDEWWEAVGELLIQNLKAAVYEEGRLRDSEFRVCSDPGLCFGW